MSTLRTEDFPAFFAALNGGATPFSWQQEMVDRITRDGRWPDQIIAPTGSGKSSVVDIHLFVNALHAAGTAPRVPRRLSVVVNRRALVDNQAERAQQLQKRFAEALHPDSSEADIIRTVARLLNTFMVGQSHENHAFLVGHLRGQLVSRSLAPIDEPSACAIIAATPDMFGSRLLFRGYGSSRYARPRETAIFAMDNVLVLDEAHLNRQLLLSARRVSELQVLETELGIPRLQVTETTATSAQSQQEGLVAVGVDPDQLDAEQDRQLQHRVHSSKELVLVPLSKWSGRPANTAVVAALAEQSQRLVESARTSEHANRTVGCLVNHVDTALQVSGKLQKAGLRVLTLVGRLRPADLRKRQRDLKPLMHPEGETQFDVVVATQTLEVGMDLDFAGMVTDLAPGSALAQRFGRVNRRGVREHTEIAVLVPEQSYSITADVLPYTAQDLNAAHEWLLTLRDQTHPSVNPATLATWTPPTEQPRRLLFQRPELSNLLTWARTSDRLFEDDDLDLWLKDSVEPELAAAGVVIRGDLPEMDTAALELLRALPPEDSEVFPVRMGELRDLLERYRRASTGGRFFLLRDNEILPATGDEALRPGDVLILEPLMPMTAEGVVTNKYAVDVPKQVLPERVVSGEVHVYTPEQWEKSEQDDLLELFVGLSPEEATELWHARGQTGNIIMSQTRIESDGRGTEVLAWFYAEQVHAAAEDQEVRQEWTPTRGKVLLDDHQQAVARRSDQLSVKLQLSEHYRTLLHTAAAWHDAGKSDPRYQVFLGKTEEDGVLAKSRKRNPQQIRLAGHRSGLPRGWRHEQFSVVLAAEAGITDPLTLRVVGCSHGRGRSGFPHTGPELLGQDVPESRQAHAAALFTIGEWDELIEQTNHNTGVYVTAYLEAIERAADAQISSEGK